MSDLSGRQALKGYAQIIWDHFFIVTSFQE